jgi:hypothetical protein
MSPGTANAPSAPASNASFELSSAHLVAQTLDGIGLSARRRAKVEWELQDHLWSAYEAGLERGLAADVAAERALAAYGDGQRVRRQLIRARILRDARRALRMPRRWQYALAVDVLLLVGSVHWRGESRWSEPGTRAAMSALYSAAALLVDWAVLAAMRFSVSALIRAHRRQLAPREGAAAVAVGVLASGVLLLLQPGAAAAAACDAIGGLLGSPASIGAPAAVIGTLWTTMLYSSVLSHAPAALGDGLARPRPVGP